MAGRIIAKCRMIEGCELRFVESLDNSQNGGVDEADVGVSVLREDFLDSKVIVGLEIGRRGNCPIQYP